MKIVLTGGGTGGHFFPLIAVAEELTRIIDKENIADTTLYYLADKPYNKKILYENNIVFKRVSAGKLRLQFSLRTIPDLLKAALGLIEAVIVVFSIYPDVVFSKGGYVAFPTVFAARLLGIPIIIHESDSIPGRVNKWSGKFARAVAVSYKQEIDYFPEEKVIHTGQPIRRDLLEPTTEGAHEFLDLERDVPVLLVLGGSLGAQTINYAVEQALPLLLEKYQIVHQVGKNNFEEIKKLTDATLTNNHFKHRYHVFGELNTLALKMLAGVTDIVISRAGSTLFEIARWEIPSIIIPITHSQGNHQIKNAYNYAREGACIVIEENNLSEQLLVFEINRIFDDPNIIKNMKEGAKRFAIPDAAKNIAEEIVSIALAHEK
ncbi:UDP-N-acetylglucosamine--N-acetylmuramyl-(pentapeptide) pyrophosphoryl-undecaprenol N-acetylglucosamine transferase [Patescibacteria group bacterium]|nr:UDP-N-acetylglucosamine--N-acetylmuramyl-(pentapeptide) pyrophosphoryl-undecaprenol N-acetylglucosamine transferase [Patescibacteria group bacterium]